MGVFFYVNSVNIKSNPHLTSMKKINFLLIGTSIFLLCTNLSSAKKFTDIKEEDKYYLPSRYLSEKEIINGYGDGTFKPEKDISRAELLKIIFEGNKTKTTNPDTNCFPDVGYQEWYSKYVCTAKDLKIISGYDDGNFKPDQTINKAEALKIMGEFYKWDTKNDPKQAWYSKYIDFSKNQNLLEDSDNFDPEKNMSRGEMSSTLYRFLANREYNVEKFSDTIENKIAIKISAQDITEEDPIDNDKLISRNLVTPQIIQLTPGEIKVVFTWEMPETPPEQEKTEFNSYLLEPTDELIYSEHKIDSKVDTIMEEKTNSETFTIRNLKPDVKETNGIKDYLFFAQSLNGETTFNEAKAKIDIYDKKGLVKSITAYPKDENTEPLGNRIWKIFTLDENYEMRIFNSLGSCDEINRQTEICPQGLGE